VTSNSLYFSIPFTGTGAHIEVTGLPLIRLPCHLKFNCDFVVFLGLWVLRIELYGLWRI